MPNSPRSPPSGGVSAANSGEEPVNRLDQATAEWSRPTLSTTVHRRAPKIGLRKPANRGADGTVPESSARLPLEDR